MGRLIDESLLQEKLALIPMEERTFRRTVEELENAPTVEAIPKADYETRLKADMVAMLTEILLEIEQCGVEDSHWIIKEKINALKGKEDGKIG